MRKVLLCVGCSLSLCGLIVLWVFAHEAPEAQVSRIIHQAWNSALASDVDAKTRYVSACRRTFSALSEAYQGRYSDVVVWLERHQADLSASSEYLCVQAWAVLRARDAYDKSTFRRVLSLSGLRKIGGQTIEDALTCRELVGGDDWGFDILVDLASDESLPSRTREIYVAAVLRAIPLSQNGDEGKAVKVAVAWWKINRSFVKRNDQYRGGEYGDDPLFVPQ